MNVPSSLALPQSKLLRSRVGILILVVAAALIGVVAFFVLRAQAPPTLPTAATSPAAQALPRTVATAPAVKPAPVFYGPPAPDWVKRDLSVLPKVAAPVPTAPGAVVAVGPGAVPVASVPGAPTTNQSVATNPVSATTGTVVPKPGVEPGAPGAAVVGSPSAAVTSVAASNVGPAALAVPVAGAPATADETPKVLDANTLFQREQYVYQTTGRRDPFQSLIDGRFESQSGDGALVDVGDIHLVGIMWGSSDKFALVEDSRGRGFVLRVGDPVVNGYISGISKTELQVVQNAFGDSQTVTIQLKSKEGDPNATRNQ
jgi:hypothetical protein